MDTLKFCYDSREYDFRYERKFESPTGKWTYFGKFYGKAPPVGTLKTDKEYCVQELEIEEKTFGDYDKDRNENRPAVPALRLYHDLFDFPGATNLRKILLWDDNAQSVLKHVEHDERPPEIKNGKSIRCRIVEPVYRDSEKAMELATVYERLELLIQVIDGIQQLQAEMVRRSGGKGTASDVAHRDIKLLNVMIEPGQGSFTAVLIDFATVRKVDPNGTRSGVLSPSNTSPETVDPSVWPGPPEKTDVFAIGGLIGRLFARVDQHPSPENPALGKPMIVWREKRIGPWDESSKDALKKVYQEEYQKEKESDRISWLERALGDHFEWNHTLWASLPSKAREMLDRGFPDLLYQTMRIDPKDRISLTELRGRLVELQAYCGRETSNNPDLYLPESVHICLFNLSDTRYIQQYCASAQKTIPADAECTAFVYFREGQSAHLCFNTQGTCLIDEMQELLNTAVERLRQPNSAYGGGRDGMLYTLISIANKWESIADRYGGGGKAVSIHIFTPEIPTDSDCVPWTEDRSGGGCYSLRDAAERLRRQMAYGLDITLFSLYPPSEEEDLWYDWVQLEGAGNDDRETDRGNSDNGNSGGMKTPVSAPSTQTDQPVSPPRERWFIKTDRGKRYLKLV